MKIISKYQDYRLVLSEVVASAAKMKSGVYTLGKLTKKQLIALRNLNIIPSDRIVKDPKNDEIK